MYVMGEKTGATLSTLKCFFYDQQLANREEDALLKTGKGLSFLPPSAIYCQNPFCALIKLCYTKAPNDQASSLAPD